MADSQTCSPIDRLLQTLKAHVPGVTDGMLQLELFNTCDEFFRRTSMWRYINEVTLLEDTLQYDLAVPPDAVVVRALSVSHQGFPVRPAAQAAGVTMSSLGRMSPEMTFDDGDATFNPDASDLASGLFSYAIYRPDYITITSAPTVEQQQYPMILTLALSITKTCLECDCGDWQLEDWMYDMFFQDWFDGCVGRLYSMPAKPWASPTQAQYHLKRFRNKMALRKQEANRGFSYEMPATPLFPRGGFIAGQRIR